MGHGLRVAFPVLTESSIQHGTTSSRRGNRRSRCILKEESINPLAMFDIFRPLFLDRRCNSDPRRLYLPQQRGVNCVGDDHKLGNRSSRQRRCNVNSRLYTGGKN
eukprot:COSAG02_NODE_164_length_32230_cov_37.505587_9_plen_105_part_00